RTSRTIENAPVTDDDVVDRSGGLRSRAQAKSIDQKTAGQREGVNALNVFISNILDFQGVCLPWPYITIPGLAPVCFPFYITTWPFTKNCSIHDGGRNGYSYVELSLNLTCTKMTGSD